MARKKKSPSNSEGSSEIGAILCFAILLFYGGLTGKYGIVGIIVSWIVLSGIIALIIYLIKYWAKHPNVHLLCENPTEIDAMNGIVFEKYCAQLLKFSGYKNVIVTPPSSDFGADIVATNGNGEKWVFQCKRYSSKLGNKPIQEIVAAKSHYGAIRAGVITNSSFTEKARLLAYENKVVLLEREDLLSTVRKINRGTINMKES